MALSDYVARASQFSQVTQEVMLHAGFRAMEILNALALLYQGQSRQSVSRIAAHTERNLWPTHLRPHLEAVSQTSDNQSFSDDRPESQEVCAPRCYHSQTDATGMSCMSAMSCFVHMHVDVCIQS